MRKRMTKRRPYQTQTKDLQRHHPRYFDFDSEYAWIFCTLCRSCHREEDMHKEEWLVEELG
jgi:hypothetical protein